VTVTPTVDGNILLGPTSELVAEKTDLATSPQGLTRVFDEARRLVPSLALPDVITTFSGIRATLTRKDFLIARHEEVEGFVNVAGIQSPGLTAAPAIALKVVDLLHQEGVRLAPKNSPVLLPQRRPRFRGASPAAKQALIASDPRYGRVICRCETITEGDIVAAIHRPIGATTLDGVKFRTRAGMGRCQGGFCGMRVTEILAREKGVEPTALTKNGTESELLIGRDRRFPGDGLSVD
jgi:glycerol-3-phosphate dehydrogenase